MRQVIRRFLKYLEAEKNARENPMGSPISRQVFTLAVLQHVYEIS